MILCNELYKVHNRGFFCSKQVHFPVSIDNKLVLVRRGNHDFLSAEGYCIRHGLGHLATIDDANLNVDKENFSAAQHLMSTFLDRNIWNNA